MCVFEERIAEYIYYFMPDDKQWGVVLGASLSARLIFRRLVSYCLKNVI